MTTVTATVLLGTTCLGAAAGLVGTWAVLRRRALTGDLISHAALPGLCAAFWLSGERNYAWMMCGAMVSGLLSVLLVTFLSRQARIHHDAALGIVLSVFFALGIVFLSFIQRSASLGDKSAGLLNFSLGQAANLGSSDVLWIGGVGLAALAIILVCYKEFTAFSFDPEYARALGLPILRLDLLMMGCLAAVAVVGIKGVGVLLSPALLIIPAATARFWTERLAVMLILAALFGAAAGGLGTLLTAGDWHAPADWPWLARFERLPTGPVIVLAAAFGFGLSILIAPQRGLLGQQWRQFSLRQRIARENLLRALFELQENQPATANTYLSEEALMATRAWRPVDLRRLLRAAVARRDLEPTGQGFRFSAQGWQNAVNITRAHRLWELYLISGANIAQDHVDRDADGVEHLLPPELLDELEADLRVAGRWPADAAPLPHSPHELSVTLSGLGSAPRAGEPPSRDSQLPAEAVASRGEQ